MDGALEAPSTEPLAATQNMKHRIRKLRPGVGYVITNTPPQKTAEDRFREIENQAMETAKTVSSVLPVSYVD